MVTPLPQMKTKLIFKGTNIWNQRWKILNRLKSLLIVSLVKKNMKKECILMNFVNLTKKLTVNFLLVYTIVFINTFLVLLISY